MLQLSNVLKLNDEELIVLVDLLHLSGSEGEILKQTINIYDIGLIALTKRSCGSLLFTEQQQAEQPGLRPERARLSAITNGC